MEKQKLAVLALLPRLIVGNAGARPNAMPECLLLAVRRRFDLPMRGGFLWPWTLTRFHRAAAILIAAVDSPSGIGAGRPANTGRLHNRQFSSIEAHSGQHPELGGRHVGLHGIISTENGRTSAIRHSCRETLLPSKPARRSKTAELVVRAAAGAGARTGTARD